MKILVLDMTDIITISNNNNLLNDNQKKQKLVLNLLMRILKFIVNYNFRMKRVNIELGELTQHNLKQLKVLNRDIFPVSYNEKFYKDVLDVGELCKLGNSYFLNNTTS
jgi:hypothetical protein